MSLASLVAVPNTHSWISSINDSTGGKFACSLAQPSRFQAVSIARAVKRAPGLAVLNAALSRPVSLGSSFLGVSRNGQGWGDARRSGLWTGSGYGLRGGVKELDRKKKKSGEKSGRHVALQARASGFQETVAWVMEGVKWGWSTSPPTWESSFISMGSIFVVGAPALFAGLTKSGILSAYLLGSIIWRAYGGQGLLTIVFFYLIGTAATKVKLKEKQKEGIAEKRSGRRGPASVWGSGSAGAICALCSIYEFGGPEFAPLWQLGYLASLCTKLSDTISSEIGKAYGKTTYLVTTFSEVPRGTEGAVSLEGTIAGVIAAIFLAASSLALHQVDLSGAVIAVCASQIANLFESYLGATLQGRAGYEWLSNDLVNVANITVGATLAMLLKKFLI